METQSSSAFSANAATANEKPAQALSRLGRIKRQLLDTNDWAGIAATRPVKMSFTPTQELERFGKRRKLTEADHDRLVPSGKTGHFDLSMSHERTPRAPSEFGTTGDVNIRIHGAPVNTQYPTSKQCRRNNESSQPMLLDRVEPDCMDQGSPGRIYDERDRERTHSSLLLSSNECPRIMSLLKQASSFMPSRTGSPERSVSQSNDETSFIDRSSSLIRHSKQPSRSLVSSSPGLYHPMPQPLWRFTIDDQVAAELEAESNAVGTSIYMPHYQEPYENGITNSYTTSKFQFELMQGLGHTAPDTQSTLSNQCSGWLPEPRHQIQRFVGQETQRDTSYVATPPNLVDYGRSIRDEPGPRTNNMGHCVSPVKLFGQTVAIDGGTVDSIQNHRQLPYGNQHELYQFQYGALPVQYITPSPQPLEYLKIPAQRHIL